MYKSYFTKTTLPSVSIQICRLFILGACLLTLNFTYASPNSHFFTNQYNTFKTKLIKELAVIKSANLRASSFFPTTAFPMVEDCFNEYDDDGDGLVDCFDSDCAGQGSCDSSIYRYTTLPNCQFVPPTIDEFEITELYKTDFLNYPIDQRSGVYVGDMDGDGIAELVAKDPNPGRIQIFSGVDGSIKQSIVIPTNHPFSQTAIADVDRNGKGDIFVMVNSKQLRRYEYGSTNVVWNTANNIGDNTSHSTPQIADFDQDGTPEVYVGNRIFDALTGTRLAIGNGSTGKASGNGDKFPIAFDVFAPGDTKPGGGTFGVEAQGLELITGNQVYTYTPGNGTQDNGTLSVVASISGGNFRDGFTSIADIDGDNLVDIVVMAAGKIYCWNPRTQMQIGTTYNIPSTSTGGRINIGDFDNDGMVEIGTAGKNRYVVLEYDAGSDKLVVKWQKTGLDDGSQRTGSTLFDFEGDGINEVVYSEEANLYVWRGTDGAELVKIPAEAGTRTEYPVVADVNNDGAAEIIITAQNGNGPGFSGNDFIRVFQSMNTPWVTARKVWNQHGYFVTNINDDLTVPKEQQNPINPALNNAYNGFLVQATILNANGGNAMPAFAAPDGTNRIDSITDESCPNLVVHLTIKNEGSAELPASTPIAFYDHNPTYGSPTLLGTSKVGTVLNTGDSTKIKVELDISPLCAPIMVFSVINDDGSESLPYSTNDFPITGVGECSFNNNMDSLMSPICIEICGDGIDNDKDGITDEPNITATDTSACSNSTLPTFTADESGGMWKILSDIGSTISTNGTVTLGTNHSPTPNIDTVVYIGGLCSDTLLVSTFDDKKPVLTCPNDQNATANANCIATIPDFTAMASVTDNCSTVGNTTLIQSPASGTNVGLGTTTITITATDEAGNMSSCQFPFIVTDTTKPTITCPSDITVNVDVNCNFELPDYTGLATTGDNCSIPANITVTQSPAIGTTISGHNTTQPIILTARDESGNTQTCTFIVTLNDNTKPTITCPANITLNADADCNVAIGDYTAQAVVMDNCTKKESITVTQSPAPTTLLTSHGDSETVTLTANDGNGNTQTCTFTVSLQDITPPVLSCPSDQVLLVDTNCEITIPDYRSRVSKSDNCLDDNSIVLTQKPTAGTTIGVLDTMVVITIIGDDTYGNTDSCSFTLTLKDEIKPTITCPADITVNLDGNCQAVIPDYTTAATIADNCTLNADLTITQTPPAGQIISDTGSSTIIITVEDESGNTANCTFNVTYRDNTLPTINCPTNDTLGVDGTCAIPLPDYTGNATLSDNCSTDESITVTQSPAPGTMVSGDGTDIPVTLTAKDESGNTQQCNFTVSLRDLTKPSISCPGNKNIYADAMCKVSIPDYTSEAVVSTNCTSGGTITVTQSPAPNTPLMGHGTNQIITLTATDGSGNASVCTFNVTVLDTIRPNLVCPADSTIYTDNNCKNTIPDLIPILGYSDNCTDNTSLMPTQSPAAGTSISGDSTQYTVTFSLSDGNGNQRQCSMTVALVDTTAPKLVCISDQMLFANTECKGVIPNYIPQIDISDNCASGNEFTTSQNPNAGTVLTGHNANETVVITVTDNSGNSATCTFEVVLKDTLAPKITCPANQQIVADNNCQIKIPDYTKMASVSDNCTAETAITVTQKPAIGTVLSTLNADTTITLIADDGNGNVDSCQFTLALIDQTMPTISCLTDQTIYLNNTCANTLNDFRDSLAITDNCSANSNLTITQFPAPNTPISQHNTNIAVTIQVTDQSNNTATCAFNVVLKDTIPPSITCPADKMDFLGEDCMFKIPDYRSEVVTIDNCTATVTVTQKPAPQTVLAGHNTMQTITFVADDGNGNLDSCSIVLTLKDTINPSIICPLNPSIIVDTDCKIILPDYTQMITVSDNCKDTTAIVVTQTPAAGTELSGSNLDQTVKLYANDGNGNIDSCAFVVSLTDTLSPTITCPENQTIIMDEFCQATMPDYTGMSMYNDNCLSSGITITQRPAAGTVLTGTDSFFITFIIAEDFDGNKDSCDFVVSLKDTLKPTVACPTDFDVYVDEACIFEVENYASLLTISDNCHSGEGIEVLQFPPEGTKFTGANTTQAITLAVVDASGNETQCNFNITLLDTLAPKITCPPTQFIDVNGTCSIEIPDYTKSVTIDDNCSLDENITVTQSPTGILLSSAGTMQEVTIKAEDESGNIDSCKFMVSLVDKTAPALSCIGNQDIQADVNCEVTIPDYRNQIVLTNDCDDISQVTLTQKPTANTMTLSGLGTEQKVTIIATDQSGNQDSCSFMVVVADTIKPTVTCLAGDTLYLDACFSEIPDYTNLVTASDNCSADSEITIQQSIAAGQLIIEDHEGTRNITIYAQDAANNIASCSFVITFLDTFPPYIDCPADSMIYMDAGCTVTLPDFTDYTINLDNCADLADVVVTQDPLPNTVLQGSDTTYTITLTADDGHGNQNTCSFKLILEDTISPIIACLDTQYVYLDDKCEATLKDYTTVASVSDNCSESPKLIFKQTPAAGKIFNTPKIPQTIELTTDDSNGNYDTCKFILIHLDTIKPKITCPPDEDLIVDEDCQIALTDYTDAMVSDNCSSTDKIVVTQSPKAGTLVSGHGNTTIVTLTATDECGNTQSCSFTLNHKDTIAPKLTCVPNQKLVVDNNCAVVLPDFRPMANVKSSCQTTGSYTLQQLPAAGTVLTEVGTKQTVQLIATDNQGNARSCTFEVALTMDLPDLYIKENVAIATPTTICLDEPCIEGKIRAYTKTGKSTGIGTGAGGTFHVDSLSGCVTYEVGAFPTSDKDTFCIVVCDENNCCDTVNYHIEIDNYQAYIIDPCVCLDNESALNTGDGQFYEYIKITGLSNETWTIIAVNDFYENPAGGITIPTRGGTPYPLNPILPNTNPFLEVPRGNGISDYYLGGLHIDGVGYSLSVSNRNDTLSVANTCTYDVGCRGNYQVGVDGLPPQNPSCAILIGNNILPAISTLQDCQSCNFSSNNLEHLYTDTIMRSIVHTICSPDDWKQLKVTFSHFDLAMGDTLYVYDGKTVQSPLVGKYSGTGVSQTGGWLSSNCDPAINNTGCLTFEFKTNGDNNKGTGWQSDLTCTDKEIVLKADDFFTPLACSEAYKIVTVRPATITTSCALSQDTQFIRIYNPQGILCKDTCLGGTEIYQDTFAVGTYYVEYKLKKDTAKTTRSLIQIQSTALVCNDKLNIPWGTSCGIMLSPDDLLENPCDTLTDTLYYYIDIIDLESGKVLASGGGKGGNYPLLTKDKLAACGGSVKVSLEKRYYENLNVNFCTNGVYKETCETIVHINDQSAPIFQNLSLTDTFKLCVETLTPSNLGIPTPTAIDNCDSATVSFVRAVILNDGGSCDTTRANLLWEATDACGNRTTATQSVVLIRPTLTDIVKTTAITLSCNDDKLAVLNNPSKTGIPSIQVGKIKNGLLLPTDTIALSESNYICGYSLQKREVELTADCGTKVFRYWGILDWCDATSGVLPIDTQLIELKDTLAPNFVANNLSTKILELGHQACTYDIKQLNSPLATDNCSTPSVRMDAIFRIENGHLWAISADKWATLDSDSFQVRWVAADNCPEQLKNDTLTQLVLIEDKTLPSVSCTDKIHLAIGTTGAQLHYRAIDQGSFDACGIQQYEISRDAENWDSIVTFSCEDVHFIRKVYLRVTDTNGNQNTCWTFVNIEDKIAPICSDLPDITGSCTDFHAGELGSSTDHNGNYAFDNQEWEDLSIPQMALYNRHFGQPYCSDNVACQTVNIEQQYQLIEKSCGAIQLKRRYRASDGNGVDNFSNWVEQHISLEAKANWTITLPADWTSLCNDTIPAANLAITNGSCDVLGYEVEEKVFNSVENTCLKIVRTYTIINWCQYETGSETITIARPENKHGLVETPQVITAKGYENIGKLKYVQILKLQDTTRSMALVSGTINDWKAQAVEDVHITATTNVDEKMTQADGTYRFELPMYENYTIQPSKNDKPLNGVSTFDLILISKHILGIETFENPYQMIAADVNQSGTITAYDMVQIRQLILTIKTAFPSSDSWRFVDAAYEFTTDNPLTEPFPQVTSIRNLSADRQANFVAIKMGDVNGNARPNNLIRAAERTPNNTLEIFVKNQYIKAGERYQVAFNTQQLAEIQGYQFTLAYANLTLEKLHSGIAKVTNFGVHKMQEGFITTSWNHSLQPKTQNPELITLFTLDFTATKDGVLSEQLQLLDKPTALEAYAKNGERMAIELRYQSPTQQQAFELYQNQPNPFRDKTTIGFYLPKASKVRLVLRNEIGQTLKILNAKHQAGFHQFEIDKTLLSSGVIYYQLFTDFGTKTKKMIKME